MSPYQIFFVLFLIGYHCVEFSVCFYIPGVVPINYHKDKEITIQAVKMTSSRTQLPYEYFSLPFCPPKDVVYDLLNLGEILRGDRIVSTGYVLKGLLEEKCRILCSADVTQADANLIKKRIIKKYYIHLLLDNLPVVEKKISSADATVFTYVQGFPIGFYDKDSAFINNHLMFNILYNEIDADQFRIVGFEVQPVSVNEGVLKKQGESDCVNSDIKKQSSQKVSGDEFRLTLSYSVKWVKSNIEWASRWDSFLAISDTQIHWFSIINSIIIIIFLSGILAMIIMRTLKKDIAKYNREDEDESIEESGWKLVHGDVFRPPKVPHIFAALIGSGVQLLLMSILTIFFAMLGMLSPASQGAFISMGLFSFVFMGIFAGFYSARLYKTFRGQYWKSTSCWTALLVPGFVFLLSFLLNLIVWSKSSSGAIPFGTLVALVAMWLGISFPLIFFGSYFGYRKQPYQHPVRTNQIPRAVPPQKWHNNVFVISFFSGLLPFGAVFIELFFIFSAIWDKQIYYMFGFLGIVFVIMVISISQISIVLVYFQLCSENYHWWWRSFLASAGIGLYVLGYSLFYYFTRMQLDTFVSTFLYFGYSIIIALLIGLIAGTIGFYAAYFFVIKIYGSIKID